jgi:hypothetical protein
MTATLTATVPHTGALRRPEHLVGRAAELRPSPTKHVDVACHEEGTTLRQLMRALKLGMLLDTLPERLALARQQQLAHADFLELILADEVTRRDANSAALRARAAG